MDHVFVAFDHLLYVSSEHTDYTRKTVSRLLAFGVYILDIPVGEYTLPVGHISLDG